MYLSGDDNLSAADRARMQWIAERLHWLGLAIVQATVSGMFATVANYESEKRRLVAEQTALRARATAAGAERQEAAEAGPLGINRLLASIGALGKALPVALAVGVAGYLLLRGRR